MTGETCEASWGKCSRQKQTHDVKVCMTLFQRTARPVWYRVEVTEGKSDSDEMEWLMGIKKDFGSHF